jgi:hypothetical protein
VHHPCPGSATTHTRRRPARPYLISPANAPVEAKERWVNKLWVLWVH